MAEGADDRTEAASPRRLEKARQDGDVAVSRELSMLVSLGAGILAAASQAGGTGLQPWLARSLQETRADPASLAALAAGDLLAVAAPVWLAAAGGFAAATLVQTGFLLRLAALKPDLLRISPLRGFKRVAGIETASTAAKAIVKLGVLACGLFFALRRLVPILVQAPDWQPSLLLHQLLAQSFGLLLLLLGAQAAVALLDLLWVRFQHAKKLRMSRQELRDEHKESDGNPHVKQRLRQLARSRAKRRMMAAVPKAAVVVTNPTHFAVALAYDRGARGAPRMVAKGADELAAKIREVARESRIPIVANPPLARALYRIELRYGNPGGALQGGGGNHSLYLAHAQQGRPAVRAARAVRRVSEDEAIVGALFGDESAGVALLDESGRLVRANKAFATLARSRPGEAAWPGLPEPVQRDLHRGVRDRFRLRLSAEVQNGAGRSWIGLLLTPIEGGGALLRVSDRTHEQQLEDQLAQAQRLQAVGELAGGIAHDFNNLLTAIMGGVDDLLARAQAPCDLDDLAHVRASAERGAALVRQLLAFGRQQTLQPQIVALNEAIAGAATLLRRLLGSRITLTLDLEEPGRRVWIDPTQLDQVLVNLAVNARHAMPAGGTLAIASFHRLLLAPETCRGETVPPGRYAAITVSDTGTGIPPDLLPRIFEPFFTTRRDSGGTGLGLSMVHGIIRQSGGFLFVDSEPGRYTAFTILLPRHEAQPWQAQPKPVAAPRSPGGDGRTVLLVEDEAPVRRLAERALLAQGWLVLAASCGQEALEVAEPPACKWPALCCVVSDVVMPGLDGPSLVQALRKARPDLPAILVSGYADAELRERLAGGDIHFMPKPFAMRDMVAAVADHCRRGPAPPNYG